MDSITIGGKDYSPEEVAVLAKAGVLQVGEKHDTSSATPSVAPPHGVYPGDANKFGIFSDYGVRPGMWNVTARPRTIGQYIPMERTLILNEMIDVATGVTAGSGNNVTSACTVGPKPGALKKAKIAATFGIIHMSTKIFDVTQAGMRRNRADIDREVFNSASVNNPWLPMIPGMQGEGIVNSSLRAEAFALAVELERNVGKVHFVGVAGTEDNTYRGVARQWNGLDALIKTGWTDSETGQVVPSLDAAVVTFGAAVDGGTDAFGRNVVTALIDTHYGQEDFLNRISVTPQFALVMRPDLFRALAQVWSCAYAIARCSSSSAGTPVTRDAEMQRRLYEDMLRGRYLPMEGMDIPVIVDDSIARQTLGNHYYQSDIYGVALRGNGIPTLYGEYFDMNNPEANEILSAFGTNASGDTTTLNNGMYRVFKRVTGGCYEYDFFARPRLITDAPFAHFRLDDIFYYSHHNTHEPLPSDSFYVNGGRSYLS